METNNINYFTYCENGILTPLLPFYQNIYKRAERSSKRLKSKMSKQNVYHFRKYVNTLVFKYNHFSEQEILIFLNNYMGLKKDDYTEEFKIQLIKEAKTKLNKFNKSGNNLFFDIKYNVNIKKDNNIIRKITKNFIYVEPEKFLWNDDELKKLELNKKELEKFKKSLTTKFNNKKKSEEKDLDLKDLMIINRNDIKTKKLLYSKFSSFSKERIDKIAEEIGLTEFMTESDYLIYNSLNDLLKSEIKEKLTYDKIIELFNNKISIITLKRFIKNNIEFKEKIKKFNEKLKKEKEIMEKKEVKEEVYNEEWTKKDEIELLNKLSDTNLTTFLDEEDFLENEIKEKNKKIITWEEVEEIENRKVEEWTDDDDEFFNKLNKVKSA